MNVTRNLMRPVHPLVTIVFLVVSMVTARAQTILIDIGSVESYRGLSVNNPDDNGNYWNSVWSGEFYPDIIDIDGSTTEVDFGFSSATGTDSYNGPAGVTDELTLEGDVLFTDIDAVALGNLGGALEAAFDFYVSSTFEIQQLDPTKTYDLTFFGSHKFNTDPTTVYSVYTDGTYTTLVDSVSLEVHEPGSPWLHNRDTVATLTGLAPQTDNILYVKFEASSGDYGYLNALQIEAITPDVDGDFNNDGVWDCLDIDALVGEVVAGTNSAAYDMNGDALVNRDDISDPTVGWLAVAGVNNAGVTGGNSFLEGDANLDGSVDVSDFNLWNGAKFTAIAEWCRGDFNADGSVDVSDFNVWNGNKFESSSGSSALVPEPSAVGLGILAAAVCAFIRRR